MFLLSHTVLFWLEIHCGLKSSFLSGNFHCWTTHFWKKVFALINCYFLNPENILTKLSCAGSGVHDWCLQKASALPAGGWAGPGGRSCRGSIPLTRSRQSCSVQPIPILGSKPTMTRVWSCLLLGVFCKGGAVKGREAGHGPGAGGEEAAGPQAGAAAGEREGPCGQRPGCFREERVINPWGIRIWATCQWTPDMFLAASSPSVSL